MIKVREGKMMVIGKKFKGFVVVCFVMVLGMVVLVEYFEKLIMMIILFGVGGSYDLNVWVIVSVLLSYFG